MNTTLVGMDLNMYTAAVIVMHISLSNHLDKQGEIYLEISWRLASHFFFDVGFILHTTKIFLLKVNFPCWLRIDSNHGR